MLDQITPVILTYNEAPNIGRTLEKLRWAKDIVIVDSFSTDETPSIIKQFPRARVIQREFDQHAAQWNFAIKETNIQTDWVLALDADYILNDELINEITALKPGSDIMGFRAKFAYCVFGRPLRSSVYPPVIVLFRKSKAFYRQDGHTQRLVLQGKSSGLRFQMMHDDQKSLDQWFFSQDRYMKLEARKLIESDPRHLNLTDRFRKTRFLAPLGMLWYCLFFKGVIFDGYKGWYYTFQRIFAELALSLYLMQYDLEKILPKIDS